MRWELSWQIDTHRVDSGARRGLECSLLSSPGTKGGRDSGSGPTGPEPSLLSALGRGSQAGKSLRGCVCFIPETSCRLSLEVYLLK